VEDCFVVPPRNDGVDVPPRNDDVKEFLIKYGGHVSLRGTKQSSRIFKDCFVVPPRNDGDRMKLSIYLKKNKVRK